MKSDRYLFADTYINEELRAHFSSLTVREKIKFLTKFRGRTLGIPEFLINLALSDESIVVRCWVAKNIYLEGELLKKVESDSSPLVRAALFENVEINSHMAMIFSWKKLFNSADHFQRLALMRNPGIYENLVEAVFDWSSTELIVSPRERVELAHAILSNSAWVEKSRRDFFSYDDGMTAATASNHFNSVWRLALRWDPSSKVPWGIFRLIGGDDKVKSECYQKCPDAFGDLAKCLRTSILEGCGTNDRLTLALGMRDADDGARITAYAKCGQPSSDEFIEMAKSEDWWALLGLAGNRHLSIEQLQIIGKRLNEIKPNDYDSTANRTIQWLMKNNAPSNVEDLFGYQGDIGDFLAERVRALGVMLLELQNEVQTAKESVAQKAKGFWG